MPCRQYTWASLNALRDVTMGRVIMQSKHWVECRHSNVCPEVSLGAKFVQNCASERALHGESSHRIQARGKWLAHHWINWLIEYSLMSMEPYKDYTRLYRLITLQLKSIGRNHALEYCRGGPSRASVGKFKPSFIAKFNHFVTNLSNVLENKVDIEVWLKYRLMFL